MKKILLSVLIVFIMASFCGCKDNKKDVSREEDISVSSEGTTVFESYEEAEKNSEPNRNDTEKTNDNVPSGDETNSDGILTTVSESDKTEISKTTFVKDNSELPDIDDETAVTTENNSIITTTAYPNKSENEVSASDATPIVTNSDGAIELPFIPIDDLQ